MALGGMSDRGGGRLRGRLAQKNVSCLWKTENDDRTLLLAADHAVVRQGPVVVLAP
jgi:hypothetical protein